MTVKQALVVAANIETKILLIRGQKVMLDADLAELYGVETKRLNEQMRRNIERFPEDFMFRLSAEEKAEVVANCDHLAKLKYSPTLPYAFTEHGALMLGNVLKSDRAVKSASWLCVPSCNCGRYSHPTPNCRANWSRLKRTTTSNSKQFLKLSTS